jgi:FG-GAP repeat/Abnormal spindle-like microcephaly-assoc'd, ASPM-SPD-2-Hydin
MSYSNSIVRRTHEKFLALFVAALAFLVAATGQAKAQTLPVKSATGWSSLPPDVQGAIMTALQKDDSSSWIPQAELAASNGAYDDGFGWSVAVRGSTAVVGTPHHTRSGAIYGPGAAYVFVESDGVWRQQAELTASDGVAMDYFGASVTVSGSTAVVGAPSHTFGSNQGQGAAYVFVENGGTWSQQAKLIASDGAASDSFGYSVAISGSTVVVGAQNHQGNGAAYVFVESGGVWTQEAELTASDGLEYDWFGSSVATDGTTILVGAPDRHESYATGPGPGAAYLFVESGGTWSQQVVLTASDGTYSDAFGASVAVSGNTILVGAPCHPASNYCINNPGAGAAYVFAESGGAWVQQVELTASDGAASDMFGWSVGLSGSTALVGSRFHAVGSKQSQGAAYVFLESGGTWSQQQELTASDGAANDQFGYSVAISGTTVAAGAHGHQVGWDPAQGAVYVFVPGSSTVSFSPSSLSFGNETVSDTTAARTVTLKNTGTATLTIRSIIASQGFAISSKTCGATLASNATCKVRVTFTPSQLDAATGALTFTDNGDSDGTTRQEAVALTGTGIQDATLAPNFARFATKKVGATSAAKTFTLSNHRPVELTGISVSTAGDFAVSGTTCGTSLAAKAKCTISVTFTPTEKYSRDGQLSISESGIPSPLVAYLTGTGK